MEVAWNNAVHAIDTDNALFADLAAAVTNNGEREGAARWLLTVVADFLRRAGTRHGPLDAFDFAIFDIEALAATWPVIRRAAAQYRDAAVPVDDRCLARLARFVVERLPVLWNGPSWTPHPPVTRALVLADRADTLVGLFAADLAPNGSKDPFALRRAAKHFLQQVVFPITRSQKRAPAEATAGAPSPLDATEQETACA